MRYGLPIVITDAQIAEFRAFTPQQLLEKQFTSWKNNFFIYLMSDGDTVIWSSSEETENIRLDLLNHFLNATDPAMITAVTKLATEFCVFKGTYTESSHLPIHIAASNGHTACVLAFLEKFPELYTIEDRHGRNVLFHALSQPDTLQALCNDDRFPAIRDKTYPSSAWSALTDLNLLERACVEYYKSTYQRSIEILLAAGVRIRPEAKEILDHVLNSENVFIAELKELLRKAHETAPRTSSDFTAISSGSEETEHKLTAPASATVFTPKTLALASGLNASTVEAAAATTP